MYDVIAIGGATQDIFFIDPAFPVKDNRLAFEWGEKFLAKDCLIEFGGGAANSAVGLARLGFKTAFWGQVGQDLPGEEIAKNFKQQNVSLEFLKSSRDVKTSISSVLVGLGGEHFIIMYRGRNDDLEEEVKFLENDVTQTKYYYLADVGSTNEALTSEVLKLVKKYGIKLVFVPGQNQLRLGLNKLAPVLQETELFILNVYEAYELLEWEHDKSTLNSLGLIEEKVKEALKKFAELGAKNIVITRDVCGSQAFDGKNYFIEPSPAMTQLVDTTGAGDAFAAGSLSALLKGHDLATALKWGSLESASVMGAYGAQPGLLNKIPS